LPAALINARQQRPGRAINGQCETVAKPTQQGAGIPINQPSAGIHWAKSSDTATPTNALRTLQDRPPASALVVPGSIG